MQLIDFAVLDWIQAYLKGPILDIVMPIISYIGNSGMIWIVISLALIVSKKHRKTDLSRPNTTRIFIRFPSTTRKANFGWIRPLKAKNMKNPNGRFHPLLKVVLGK